MPPNQDSPIVVAIGFLLMISLFGGFFCAVLVPRCVDPAKLRNEEDKKLVGMMSNPWLPRRVLTPTGEKLWLARNYLLGAALVLVIASMAVRP